MSTKLPPIPTPLAQHWRRFRYQLIPVLVLCAAIFGVGRLWQKQQIPNVVGEVRAIRVPVRTPAAGIIDTLPGGSLKLYDHVKEGQLLARMTERAKKGTVMELLSSSSLIRSPISGTVCAMQCQPGQVVKAGEELFIIVSDQCDNIVAYVHQDQRLRAEPGQTATVLPRSAPAKSLEASILRVGPGVELIPAHQRHDPKKKEWGRPIVIALPNDYIVKPGELLDVVLPVN